MNIIDEYWESKKNPKAYTWSIRRCPGCGVRRNMFHLEDCETQREAKEASSHDSDFSAGSSRLR
jgi:hypothetical protein